MIYSNYLAKIESLVDKVEDWSLLPDDPVVSVWTITFNHEAFIGQTLDSILMQQTSFPYEIVIGEDKSTDRTREIVQNYQRCHPDKIRLRLAKENLYSQKLKPGLGVLNACRGKYVAVCEGDDYWTDPYKLQKQVDFLEAHPECSICFHQALVIYDSQSRPSKLYNDFDKDTSFTIEALARYGNFISTASCIFRRREHELPSWFLDISSGDWALHMLNAAFGPIYYMDDCMSVYRVHSTGVWSGLDYNEMILKGVTAAEMLDAAFGYEYHNEFSAYITNRLKLLKSKKPGNETLVNRLRIRIVLSGTWKKLVSLNLWGS